MADILDPRQTAFLAHYLNPKSDTFGNAKQSALQAGYSEEYAHNMIGQMPEWLSENISRVNMLGKAEKNLEKFLDDESDKRIQADITKFVAERLGKNRYSTKQEVDQTNINLNKDMAHMTDEELLEFLK